MRRVFTSIAPTIMTGIAGLIVLISFVVTGLAGLFPDWAGLSARLLTLRVILVDIAVIIVGVAVVMGFFHLLYVHANRVRRGPGGFYSIILILSALVVGAIMIVERLSAGDQPLTRFIFNSVLVPLQSSLGALLAVLLGLAALRMLQQRRTVGAVWFLLSALIVLITQIPLTIFDDLGLTPALSAVREVLNALTTGGMRGLLLGVALGTLATAFRVLFFIDRPQSE
ncbi:MAG: hypothetical protein U0559_04735 [Anaerolineae bacterium]